jgi:DNA-binding winged helix-turn-helix (wHTH) protein
MEPFRINDQFTVTPSANQVNNEKLEPRLMKLLCLLVESRGQLVSRDRIIEEIWNGYGGGDEGLTQAISFLRKILGDKDKKIIETVPKSGYVFRGEITVVSQGTKGVAAVRRQKNPFKQLAYTGILLAVLVAGVLVFLGYERNRNSSGAAGIAPKAPQKNGADSAGYAPKAPVVIVHNADTSHTGYAPKAPVNTSAKSPGYAPKAAGQ